MSTVEPTNGDTSNNNDLNTKVVTSPTRLFKDTPNPERTSDGFLEPITPKRKGAKSSKDPIQTVIPTTVIDTSEAAKLKADLEAKDKILRDYEEQINHYRFLINDPRYQARLRKEQAKRDMVIDSAVPNVESPWSINDHSTPTVNTRPPSTETLSNQSTQTIPPINNSNVNLDGISILDREQFLLNRITAGDIANKHLHEQIKANEERVKRTSPFTPISNELTPTTRWTPSGSLPTALDAKTYQHQPYQYSTIVTKPLASETPTIKTWSHSEVLLFEIWCNRHNVKQMNPRDAWDIISSTFNDEILETLDQLVAILRTRITSWSTFGNSPSTI
jgi:hypothetical protein